MSNLRFDELKEANCERSIAVFKKAPSDWNQWEWLAKLMEEVGELAETINKGRSVADIGAEIADVVIVADLLSQCLGFALGAEVQRTFNVKSAKWESNIRI